MKTQKLLVLLMTTIIVLLGIDIALRLGLNISKPEKNALAAIIQPFIKDRINKEDFEKLHRSAKAIEGVVAVGVNLPKFQELLQNMATEIAIVTDKAMNEKEKELLLIYAKALEIYKDSEAIWSEKIEHASKYDYPLYKKGYIWVREHYTSPEVCNFSQ